MLRVWQKRLLDNRPSATFEFATSGTHTQVIDAGIYDVWLVGGGGGGALLRASRTGTKSYARGGVGGVLHARINVPDKTTITINVGGGGSSRMGAFTSSGVTASGDNGTATTITGVPNLLLSAGAGTGARVQSVSDTATNRYAGVQGTNSASGSNLIAILENNVNTIKSIDGSSSENVRLPNVQPNINWEDVQKGCGGDVGWGGASYVLKIGGVGFVRIKTAD